MAENNTQKTTNTTAPQKTDWRSLEIGGLWKKVSKNNEEYFTGYIKNSKGESLNLVIYLNKYASENPNAPSHRIYKAPPKTGESAQPSQTKSVGKPPVTISSEESPSDVL